MKIEFEGLDELIKIAQSIGSESEINETNEKILKECGVLAKNRLRTNTPRSSNNANSGKSGDRPSGHLADNIPTRVVRKQAGYYYMLVGWENIGRKTPWFYAKFLEWGTSKINPPVAMFGTTQAELEDKFEKIGVDAYEKLIEKLRG